MNKKKKIDNERINGLKRSLLNCSNHTGKIMIAQSIIKAGGTQDDIDEVEVKRFNVSIQKERRRTLMLFSKLYPQFKEGDKELITKDVFKSDFTSFFVKNYHRQLLFDRAPSDMCRLFYFLSYKWNRVRIGNGIYSIESFMTPAMDKWSSYCGIREFILKQLNHKDFEFIANLVDY